MTDVKAKLQEREDAIQVEFKAKTAERDKLVKDFKAHQASTQKQVTDLETELVQLRGAHLELKKLLETEK